MGMENIEIADHALETVLSKVNTQITEQLLDAMRPNYVKKQVIQIADQASMFGNNRADLGNFVMDSEETDEPVSLNFLSQK